MKRRFYLVELKVVFDLAKLVRSPIAERLAVAVEDVVGRWPEILPGGMPTKRNLFKIRCRKLKWKILIKKEGQFEMFNFSTLRSR